MAHRRMSSEDRMKLNVAMAMWRCGEATQIEAAQLAGVGVRTIARRIEEYAGKRALLHWRAARVHRLSMQFATRVRSLEKARARRYGGCAPMNVESD